MQKPPDILAVIMFLGAVHGLFLALALLAIRRGNRIGNRILAVMLFLFSINILLHTLVHAKYSFDIPYLANIQPLLLKIFEPLAYFYVMAFAFGPLIYLYVSALTVNQFRFTRKKSDHFLPSIVCFVIVTPFYFLSSKARPDSLEVLGAIVTWLIIIHVALYIFATISLLLNHMRNIKNSFSSIEKINLKWLRFLIVSFLVTWLGALFSELYGSEIKPWNQPWILVSIFMYMIGYKGLSQPEIFTGGDLAFEGLSSKKYEKSTLTDIKAEEYLQKLHRIMKAKKLYCRNDLTLRGVAKELSISHHHLSQVINQKLKQNFYEFVNRQRIEEAKRMVTSPTHAMAGLSEIAYEVGFNSVTSFNSAFKKFTKMTPSQFRKRAGT